MDPSSAVLHLLAGKYFQIAAFVMLAYDHAITLGQEVERIWMRPKSFAALLFLLNRYGTLIQFIIIVIAFNDPAWKGESCDRYVLFEGTSTVAFVAVGQLIMILRVVALYKGSKRIFAFLACILIGQIIISVIGLKRGFAVPLPPGLVGCILTGSDTLFPSVWIAPLATDSSIFLFTIYRTRHNFGRLFASLAGQGGASVTDRAITLLLRDGVMYYFLIFLVNLMNVLIYFLAEPDIKPIGASFSQLLTCTVISRLVLNLRSLSNGNQGTTTAKTMSFNVERSPPNRTPPKQLEAMWTRTISDFTEENTAFTSETERSTSDEVPLQSVKTTLHGNDHSHQV